ncbi:MAG: helix-turn-helix domain-containing protein [Phycisphaerales bacterium JB040]
MHIDFQPGNGCLAEPIMNRSKATTSTASSIADRLREAVAGDTVAGVARRTGYNAETTRRYLNEGRVPAEFIAALSRAYGVDASWLIHGDDVGLHNVDLMARISTADLMHELDRRLDAEPETEDTPDDDGEA